MFVRIPTKAKNASKSANTSVSICFVNWRQAAVMRDAGAEGKRAKQCMNANPLGRQRGG